MVLLPYPLAGAYDYRVPCGVDLAPGDFVEVPLGPRRVIGVVWDDAERPPADEPAVATDKLKSVLRRLDASAMRRSEEHTSALQLLMRNSYAVFCLKKKKN